MVWCLGGGGEIFKGDILRRRSPQPDKPEPNRTRRSADGRGSRLNQLTRRHNGTKKIKRRKLKYFRITKVNVQVLCLPCAFVRDRFDTCRIECMQKTSEVAATPEVFVYAVRGGDEKFFSSPPMNALCLPPAEQRQSAQPQGNQEPGGRFWNGGDGLEGGELHGLAAGGGDLEGVAPVGGGADRR